MTAESIEEIIQRINKGDGKALDELFPVVYDELRRSARKVRLRFHNQETLNTTALVHEAYLKLSKADLSQLENKNHFYHLASRAIRQILVNACEKKGTKRRGENQSHLPIEDLEESLNFSEKTSTALKNVDELLKVLESKQPIYGKIVECRFFAGLSIEETANIVGTSPSTVKRSWNMARTWLHAKLSSELNTA
ncbi:MAG: ECF-type sigma factor [Bacteroidota bacterium]